MIGSLAMVNKPSLTPWNGRYCPLCAGAIMLSARRVVLGR